MSLAPPAITAGLVPAALLAAAAAAPSPGADPSATSSPEPTTDVEQAAEAVVDTTADLLSLAWRLGLGALVGILLLSALLMVLRVAGRRRTVYARAAHFCRLSLPVAGALAGAVVGARVAVLDGTAPEWVGGAEHAAVIGLILASTWVVVGILKTSEASVIDGVRARGDQGRTNRVTTQAQILRRVGEVVVVICGLVGVVMTFPSARVAMSSLLASAGLVSVIAGLAAQSTLKNVFAGLQLATTDAIRVDDVVDIADRHGRIEEITLSYVVVRIWDGQRLIVPSTFFTENPFSNWSRHPHEMTGVVALEVDWRVPVDLMRAELARAVASCEAWDGRSAELLLTDSSASTVTARAAVSAATPDDLWVLQCHVREALVAWMQREAPQAMPRTRVEIEQADTAQGLTGQQAAQLAGSLIGEKQAQPGDETPVPGVADAGSDDSPARA